VIQSYRGSAAVAILGCGLIAAVFIIAAVGLIHDFAGTVTLMSTKHVPQPALLLMVTILVWILGGAGLMFAATRRVAALVLLAGTVVVTLVIHDFWAASPAQRANEIQHVLANLGICGGLLGLAAK